MLTNRIRAALVVLAASAGLGACTSLGPYGGVGVGIGSNSYCGGLSGYGCSPYGYGGYGSPYGYYGYGSPYYGGYPYFGWYDGFYYPGTGYWVYDPDGNQHPITDRQRNYWSAMRDKFRQLRGADATVTQNFSGFRTQAKTGATIAGVDLDAKADQRSLRQIREVRRQAAQTERQQVRSEAQQARTERQQSMREVIMERREQRRARRSGGGS